jgi:hypothetical protein
LLYEGNNDTIYQENGNDNSDIDPYQPDDTEPPKEIDVYRLVFNDEFNHEGPMKVEYCNAETGFRRNNETQWYQAENGICKDGRLIITAKREKVKNPNYVEGSNEWREKEGIRLLQVIQLYH